MEGTAVLELVKGLVVFLSSGPSDKVNWVLADGIIREKPPGS